MCFYGSHIAIFLVLWTGNTGQPSMGRKNVRNFCFHSLSNQPTTNSPPSTLTLYPLLFWFRPP